MRGYRYEPLLLAYIYIFNDHSGSVVHEQNDSEATFTRTQFKDLDPAKQVCLLLFSFFSPFSFLWGVARNPGCELAPLFFGFVCEV